MRVSVFYSLIVYGLLCCLVLFFVSSRRLHTRCALVTGVQTCALPICLSSFGHPQFLHPARPGRTDRRSAHRRHRRASPGLSPMKLLDQPIDLIGIATIARAVREGRLSAVALIESRRARHERPKPRPTGFTETPPARVRPHTERVDAMWAARPR